MKQGHRALKKRTCLGVLWELFEHHWKELSVGDFDSDIWKWSFEVVTIWVEFKYQRIGYWWNGCRRIIFRSGEWNNKLFGPTHNLQRGKQTAQQLQWSSRHSEAEQEAVVLMGQGEQSFFTGHSGRITLTMKCIADYVITWIYEEVMSTLRKTWILFYCLMCPGRL